METTPLDDEDSVWYTGEDGRPQFLSLNRHDLIQRNRGLSRALHHTDLSSHEQAQLQAMSLLDLLNLTAANEKLLYRVRRNKPDTALIGQN